MSDVGSDPDLYPDAATSSAPRPSSSSEPPREGPSADRLSPRDPSLPPPIRLRDTIGEACGLALVSCLLGSIPASLRVSREGGSLVGGLLVAAAIVLPLLAVTISLSRAAGRGFRMVTGLRAGRSTAALIGLWIGLIAPVLLVLGALLKDKTNHRGLGGTTFGVLALFVAIGGALVAKRLVQTGRWLVDRGVSARNVAIGLAVLAIAPTFVVSLPLLSGHDPSPHAPAVAAALIDGVLFVVAGAVAVTYDVGERARAIARRYGLPAAASLLATGALWLSASPALALALRSGGGLAAAMVGSLERWTDRDGDGYGSHFGGADCDEGDPRRFPGAADPPDDGVDQDCDGADGVASATSPAQEVAPSVPSVTASAEPVPALPPPVVLPIPTRPSIVLVTLDTVRADHTSAYGYDKKTTPRLEALAAHGALFEHAYAPASDTQRAYLPLFSAVSYRDTPKSKRSWPTLQDEANTLAERMKAAGYQTAFVSSFQWMSEERGFHQGFDHFTEAFREEHPERGVTGPHAIRAARAILEKTQGDAKPLFLWVQLFDAHEEYHRHQGFSFGHGDEGAYDSEIAFVDKQLGDLVDAVEASPLKGKVAWIVHGSQGEGFGEHDVKGHGRELYEEMVRVPLIVALPGAPETRIKGAAVSTLDIVPTVLELAGASGESVGVSLAGAARGLPLQREPVRIGNSKRSALIDFPLKIVLFERGEKRDRVLLFDLAADPNEQKDLSSDRREDVSRLKTALEADAPNEKRN